MGDLQNSGSVHKDLVELFRKSEKMLTALLESATQAILSIDQTGRIVLANRRCEEMFGYSREELLGARIEILLPESQRRAHADERNQYFQRPHVRPMGLGIDLAGRRRDGQEFPVEVSLSYIETDEGTFAIAFVSDIGQRKRLEEQLLHSQKMEAVGRLAGGVAHDFNNMLTVIAGYNRMLLDELPVHDPLRSYAEEILKAADRASAITHQLLTFSRRQISKPRVIHLNLVVAHADKMLRRLIGEDVQLQLRLAADIGNVKADPGQVEQAIVNLAVNGRDAMPNGGALTIETANVRLDENYLRTNMGMSPGEFVMLSVSDTGHGMDAETRRRVFDPFFTTKDRGRGTGLGLATVYGIVQQANGDIWVYSEPGRGSTFKLYFPRVSEPLTESHEPGAAQTHTAESAQTILLVEDEKAVRELTLTMLRQLGYAVLTAESGDNALRISQAHTSEIALLVTDVVMPGMSGRQLADALMLARPGLRVLFLSGYTENTVVHHGVLGAGVDFLPKPFSREVLGKKLREILAR